MRRARMALSWSIPVQMAISARSISGWCSPGKKELFHKSQVLWHSRVWALQSCCQGQRDRARAANPGQRCPEEITGSHRKTSRLCLWQGEGEIWGDVWGDVEGYKVCHPLLMIKTFSAKAGSPVFSAVNRSITDLAASWGTRALPLAEIMEIQALAARNPFASTPKVQRSHQVPKTKWMPHLSLPSLWDPTTEGVCYESRTALSKPVLLHWAKAQPTQTKGLLQRTLPALLSPN